MHPSHISKSLLEGMRILLQKGKNLVTGDMEDVFIAQNAIKNADVIKISVRRWNGALDLWTVPLLAFPDPEKAIKKLLIKATTVRIPSNIRPLLFRTG